MFTQGIETQQQDQNDPLDQGSKIDLHHINNLQSRRTERKVSFQRFDLTNYNVNDKDMRKSTDSGIKAILKSPSSKLVNVPTDA